MTKYIKRTAFNRKYPGRKNRDIPSIDYNRLAPIIMQHLGRKGPIKYKLEQEIVIEELERVVQHDWTIRSDPRCSGISGGGSVKAEELITFTNQSDYDLVRLLYL